MNEQTTPLDEQKENGISVETPEVELSAPDVEVEAPAVELSTPEVDVAVEAPAVELSAPEVDVEVETAKVELAAPEVDVEVETPAVELSAPEVDVAVETPAVELSTPEVDVAVETPTVELSAEVEGDSSEPELAADATASTEAAASADAAASDTSEAEADEVAEEEVPEIAVTAETQKETAGLMKSVSGPPEYVPNEKMGRVQRIGNDVRLPDINHKNIQVLSRFLDRHGRIIPRRKTHVSAKVQRQVVKAIKRARYLALLPYTGNQTRIIRKKR